MIAPYIIIFSWPSLCQKLSELVEIWQSYAQNDFDFFFDTVYLEKLTLFLTAKWSTNCCLKMCCVVVTMVMPYQPQHETNIAVMELVICQLLLNLFFILYIHRCCYLYGKQGLQLFPLLRCLDFGFWILCKFFFNFC